MNMFFFSLHNFSVENSGQIPYCRLKTQAQPESTWSSEWEEHIVFHLNSCLLFGQIRKGIPLNSTDSVKERRSLGQKRKEHLSGRQKTLLLVTAFFLLWIYDLGSASSFLEALVFSSLK